MMQIVDQSVQELRDVFEPKCTSGVAVWGVKGSGKTTLLNALLKAPIFPPHVDCVVTYEKNGNTYVDASSKVVFENGGKVAQSHSLNPDMPLYRQVSNIVQSNHQNVDHAIVQTCANTSTSLPNNMRFTELRNIEDLLEHELMMQRRAVVFVTTQENASEDPQDTNVFKAVQKCASPFVVVNKLKQTFDESGERKSISQAWGIAPERVYFLDPARALACAVVGSAGEVNERVEKLDYQFLMFRKALTAVFQQGHSTDDEMIQALRRHMDVCHQLMSDLVARQPDVHARLPEANYQPSAPLSSPQGPQPYVAKVLQQEQEQPPMRDPDTYDFRVQPYTCPENDYIPKCVSNTFVPRGEYVPKSQSNNGSV